MWGECTLSLEVSGLVTSSGGVHWALTEHGGNNGLFVGVPKALETGALVKIPTPYLDF